jgi:hypothetical protein
MHHSRKEEIRYITQGQTTRDKGKSCRAENAAPHLLEMHRGSNVQRCTPVGVSKLRGALVSSGAAFGSNQDVPQKVHVSPAHCRDLLLCHGRR